MPPIFQSLGILTLKFGILLKRPEADGGHELKQMWAFLEHVSIEMVNFSRPVENLRVHAVDQGANERQCFHNLFLLVK